MATDFDRLVYMVEALHQEVLNLRAFVAVQNEQLNSFAALVKDLVQARETERAQFAALLQQLVETTGGMVTELQQQVGAAFQVMQQDLDVLMGRQ
jgi:DNA-binding protein H-NS